jgi:RNAse (barnase) inhibitor barstar
MIHLTFDLYGIKSEDDFHDRAAEVFGFPQYYGRNQDAFWDCIGDFVEETNVRVLNLDSIGSSERAFVSDYIKMLEDYQKKRQGRFTVVYQ